MPNTRQKLASIGVALVGLIEAFATIFPTQFTQTFDINDVSLHEFQIVFAVALLVFVIFAIWVWRRPSSGEWSDDLVRFKLFVPDEHDFGRAARLPYPVDGFLGLEVHNGNSLEDLKDCSVDITTDIGEFKFYKWPKKTGDALKTFDVDKGRTEVVHARVEAGHPNVVVTLKSGIRTIGPRKLSIPLCVWTEYHSRAEER